MINDRLDIIIFGATGFTGQYAVKYAAHFCKEWQLKFGVAGRRKEALKAVLKEFAPDVENVPIILANVNHEESLKKMTERTKILVNCCGPYRFYGEPVVKTCIATRTHYVDVTCELQFMYNMQLLYNKTAQETGVYIVTNCGADSILVDLGITFAKKKLGEQMNSIEIYCLLEKSVRPIANYGTWESIIYSLSNWNEVRELCTKLYSDKMPEFTTKLKTRGFIHKSNIAKGWSVLFPAVDYLAPSRTNRFLYDKYKEAPVQLHAYMTFKSFFALIIVLVGAIFIYIMTRTTFTRKLLLKYPTLFSGGFVRRGNLTHQSMEHTRFSVTFRALAWSEKLAETSDKHTDLPNKELITKVSGAESGYGVTCKALILSAIMILKEADKMPDNGGVLSPGAAFEKTSLIKELDKNGIKFEVIKSSEK